MASLGNDFIRKISLGTVSVDLLSREEQIVWFDRDRYPIGVSPDMLSFDALGFPRNQRVVLEYPTEIFSAFDIQTGITTPTGITATARHLGVSGGSAFIEVLVNADPTPTTNTLLQQITFTFQDMSTYNVNTRRSGQADLDEIHIVSGAATTSLLGGTGTVRVSSIPAGATYSLAAEQTGGNDDTASFSITPTTGTAGSTGSGGTIHTFTWAANTLQRQRQVSLQATNSLATEDVVPLILSQGADTDVDASLTVNDTTPFIGETVTLTTTVLTGDAPYDFRIFSGDTTGTLDAANTAFTSTTNRVATADSMNTLAPITRTAVDGENTYTLYVRETNTPSETVTRVLTFHATAALAIQVPNITLTPPATYATQSNIPWYENSALLYFRTPGIPSSASLSASVTGTDATIGAVTQVSGGTIPGTGEPLWQTTVSWSSGNPSRTSTRTAEVTISYHGANMFGTLAVRQNALNSIVTDLNILGADGTLNDSRDWNELGNRLVGVSISNFPGIGQTIGNFATNGSSVLTEYSLPVLSRTSSGATRSVTVSRDTSVLTDSIVSEVGLSSGSVVVLQGTDGEYSEATVTAVNTSGITFSGVRAIVAESSTLLFVSYGYSEVLSTRSATTPVTGVALVRSGFSSQMTYSGATTAGMAGATDTAGAGYKTQFTFPSNYTVTSTPTVVQYNVRYRGVDIGVNSITVTRGPRPYVAQRLLNAAGTLIDGGDTTFETTLAATAGASAEIWIMHDVNQVFNNVTDGSTTDDDFLLANMASVESGNSVVVMPTSFINANSTVPATNNDNLQTATYARRSRIDLDAGAANTTINVEVDNININFTDN